MALLFRHLSHRLTSDSVLDEFDKYRGSLADRA
jgi:hypothetical protein